nr:hypothetical protein [Rhodopseudomonas palustris]
MRSIINSPAATNSFSAVALFAADALGAVDWFKCTAIVIALTASFDMAQALIDRLTKTLPTT